MRWCAVVFGLLGVWAGSIGSVVAGAATVTRPSTDLLVREATLTASGEGGQLGFADVAISGDTIAADSFNPMALDGPDTGVSVFTEPPDGWSSGSSAAQLTAANGESLGGPVAISGDTVFVGAPQIGPESPGAVYVFTKPARGWSGALHETAKLTASDAASGRTLGSSVGASGRTVVATDAGSVYLFTEPAGGWVGTVHETAKLVPPAGNRVESTSVSGAVVVAGNSRATVGTNAGQGAVYAFREPRGGWSGTVHASATLTGSDGAANDQLRDAVVSGRTVVASSYHATANNQDAVYTFTRPRRGWSGSVHQSAERTVSAFDGTLGPEVAISGETVAAVVDVPSAHECPCDGAVFAFDRPFGGWSGNLRISRSASLTTVGVAGEIALDRQTLVVGAQNGVDVFSALAPPEMSPPMITGLATGHPHLGVFPNGGGASITSVTITPPRGLEFSKNRRDLTQPGAISLLRRHTLSLHHGRLTVTVAATGFSIRMSAPALIESPALLRTVRAINGYNKNYRHKRTLSLTVAVSITDTAHRTTQLTTTVPIRA